MRPHGRPTKGRQWLVDPRRLANHLEASALKFRAAAKHWGARDEPEKAREFDRHADHEWIAGVLIEGFFQNRLDDEMNEDGA